MKRSSHISISNFLHLYVILLISFSITLNYWYFGFVFIYLLYRFRKLINYILIICILGIFLLNFIYQRYIPEEVFGRGIILTKEVKNYSNQYEVLIQFKKYEFNSKEEFSPFEIIEIEGLVVNFKNSTIPNGFDEYQYKMSNGITAKIDVIKIKSVFKFNVFSNLDTSKPLVKLFKDENFYEMDSLSYLLSLSSVHLTFFIFLIRRLFFYLDIKDHEKDLLISILSFIFYLIGFSILVLRMFLKYVLTWLNEQFNLSLTDLDIESFGFIVILIIHPLYIYNKSFQVLYLLIVMFKLKPLKSRFQDVMLAPLILIPYLTLWQGKVNLTLLIFTPLLISLIKPIFIPSVILVTILPILNVIPFIGKLIQSIIIFLEPYQFAIYFFRFEGILLIVYYVGLILTISAKKEMKLNLRLSIFIWILTLSITITWIPKADQVIFLDVGQGDSSVIFKNGKTIVIDSYQYVSKYLSSNYIYQIDYLILSHNDLDHMQEASELIKNFEVDTLILSGYTDYGLAHQNIILIDEGNLIEIDSIELKFLGPIRDYQNTNLNSLVFQIKVNALTFLYTGDIGVKAESDLVNTYHDKLKSDVIKVAHHGSDTSSSLEFLSEVDPKFAVVSVKDKNIYNLPTPEIIKRHQTLSIKVFETRYLGSILFYKQEIINFKP
ncbi:MBL fold metallo-hydrolase [Acholeplasma equirhinis]|uniref:ComEC/Rec2 family competence protein n=1 Tax=Acholeplasma equirhinis TaxID=555393 RepID=UPI00197A7D5B|nr:ComEC/Rec2 family competence protein [Acholeplasma equirhinis]MBN3490582.1 MBL fold metallo-hydrolase [Acholeplasma equirhinis]